MEDSDRKRRDALREDELAITQGEDEAIESEDYVNRTRGRRITFTYPKPAKPEEPEPPEPEPEPTPDDGDKPLTPDDRIERMEKAVRGFRIATGGDGFLRASFGRLPPNPARELLDRMKDLTKAMNQFNLQGDNLNVSGSFDKGYTVTRENPCQQQQVNQTPE